MAELGSGKFSVALKSMEVQDCTGGPGLWRGYNRHVPWYRVVLSVVCPPLAVIDKGAKPLLLTLVLTVLGWVPGIVCALVYSSYPTKSAAF